MSLVGHGIYILVYVCVCVYIDREDIYLADSTKQFFQVVEQFYIPTRNVREFLISPYLCYHLIISTIQDSV